MSEVCPICGCSASSEIFRALRQPAMLNRLYVSRVEALAARSVHLLFRRCDNTARCGFVWNAAFDPASVDYAPGYVNDQSQSPTFCAHLQRVQSRITTAMNSVDGDILEIGCGQGEFLREICALANRRGIGFDPAFDAAKGEIGRRTQANVMIHRQEFAVDSPHLIQRPIAAVVCRHILEHLPDPMCVLRHAAATLADGGMLYVEVPCVEWIASNGAFFDLFNEHCSLFSKTSLHRALGDAGFAEIHIEHVFGGQYLAAEARMAVAGQEDAAPGSLATLDADSIHETLVESKCAFGNELVTATNSQCTLIWGAGAKGVSLVNHLGLDSARVPALIDIHPLKQGRYVPITGQQVIAPDHIRRLASRDAPPVVLVMNPNYLDEIERMLDGLGIQADVRAVYGRSSVALHR